MVPSSFGVQPNRDSSVEETIVGVLVLFYKMRMVNPIFIEYRFWRRGGAVL